MCPEPASFLAKISERVYLVRRGAECPPWGWRATPQRSIPLLLLRQPMPGQLDRYLGGGGNAPYNHATKLLLISGLNHLADLRTLCLLMADAAFTVRG
jgi:hypothetical protein